MRDQHELKRRLRDFWNHNEEYWRLLDTEAAGEWPNRIRASRLVKGRSVLDLGCGAAANHGLLVDYSYVGVDLSITAVQIAADHGVRVVCGDVEHLPFVDQAFDSVIATYVLEHVVDPSSMLHELQRVVRAQGRVVLLGPAWDFPFWYPNSMSSRLTQRRRRVVFSVRRAASQWTGWLTGRFPFVQVAAPDALTREFVCDSDAVYVVWTYEVKKTMESFGFRLAHWEVADRLLGANAAVRVLKRVLALLPIYRLSGSTVLMMFERSS